MPLMTSSPKKGTVAPAPSASQDTASAAPPPQDAGTMIAQPFIRATDENLQTGNLDRTSAVLGAASQDFGVINIPSYGYISHMFLLATATGGAAGLNNAVKHEDGPENGLKDIQLTEPNGATIVSFNNGWQARMAQKYGGYAAPSGSDPQQSPLFSAIAVSGNFTFMLKIPVAVSSRDAVGALANQDSAGEFKFKVKIGAKTEFYATSPDTTPTVNLKAWLMGWDQPEATSGGVPNQTEPPAHGTTSFWTTQPGITINAGQNKVPLLRKGNYLRQLIFVFRRAGTSRANGQGDWPTETQFLRDSFPSRYYNDQIWRHIMWERTGFGNAIETPGGLDNGLRFHDYMHEFDGQLGRENRDLWQPSRGSTRLELSGSWANAGTLEILTNDVAIADNVFI